MARYDRAEEFNGRSIGRFMTRWSLRYLIAFLLVAATACASRGDLASAPLSEGGEAVIGAGYRFIETRYIRDIPVRVVALSGLKGMTKIDPKMQAVPSGDRIAIQHGGAVVAFLEQPPTDDIRGWAGVTVRAFEIAGKRSVKIRNAQPEEVYRAVFRAALLSLDRYSRYSTPAEARENRALREGYGGIGVTIRAENGVARVISVMPGTPGDKAGLKDNDIIAAIAGVPLRGKSLNYVVRRLRGPRGSEVRLTVRRVARKLPLTINVTRAFIVPQTVIARRAGDAVYLRIVRFGNDTARKTSDTVARLRTKIGKRKLSGAILDLRNNPGGLLEQAILISDLFLDDGEIMESRGRHPKSRRRYDARYGDVLRGKPIVVLVNSRTASSSEILAAALQDNGRAVVVGSNSFGKGTVQSVASLPNRGEIILTWSRFHAPSGYTLQGLGVRPNICSGSDRRNAGAAERAIARLIAGETAPAAAFQTWRRQIEPNSESVRVLRAACPARALGGEPDVELEIARRLLSTPRLYRLALAASAPEPDRASTGRERAEDSPVDATNLR